MHLDKSMVKSKKTIIIILAIIFIVLLLLIANFITHEVTVPVNAQLKALKAGDIAKAYSYTSKDFQHNTSLSQFEEFVKRHPVLTDNSHVAFITKETNGDVGLIKASLQAADGTVSPIEYHLVIEDGDWKILQIVINQAGVVDSNNKPSESPIKNYNNTDSRYSINYPATWDIDTSEQGTVIFSGKKDTPSFYSTVNIQTVLTKTTGGEYSTIKQFIADIKRQAMAQSPETKFLEKGPFTLKDANGAILKGEFVTFTYKYKNVAFKQWQIVVMRNDSQVFYAWAYTSPTEQYQNDLPTAKTMLASWSIY